MGGMATGAVYDLLNLHSLVSLRAVFASAVAALAMSLETNKSDFQHYIDW